MFQCIIQQKNGWIHPHNTETKDVFPGLNFIRTSRSYFRYSKKCSIGGPTGLIILHGPTSYHRLHNFVSHFVANNTESKQENLLYLSAIVSASVDLKKNSPEMKPNSITA
jgi:hypothetical protein